MKNFRHFIALILVLSSVVSVAQTDTIYVEGQVLSLPSSTPFPGHPVYLWVYPDTASPASYLRDTVFTDLNGNYSFTMNTPWIAGTSFPFSVSTYDCQSNLHQQFFWYSGNSPQHTANFSVCDTFPPPFSCENQQLSTYLGEYTMALHGKMIYPQAATYFWSFGDGNTAIGADVIHHYPGPGVFFTTLTTYTTDSCMNVTYAYYGFTDPTGGCESSFTAYQENNSFAVNFQATTTSPYPTEFSWSFGDGASGTGQNISHNYTAIGIYQVTLHSIDSTGCASVYTENIWVTDTIVNPPSNCWNYVSQGDKIGLTITLTGFLWSGQPATYYWDMGDGITYNGQTVTHTYSQTGTYVVKLHSITLDGCEDITIEPVYVSDSCKNDIYAYGVANLEMLFYASMENGFTASYFWDLGDGTQSTEQNFYHTFPHPGTYNIVLQTITIDSCVDYSTYTCTLIDSIPNGCNSYFTATAGNNLYKIHFEGSTTSPYPATFLWNFGDPASGSNNTSTLQNPDHTFSAAKTYQITLTTTDSSGCSSSFSAPVILSMFSRYNLYGQVFAGSQTITQCKVQLFSQDNTGNMNLIREVRPDSANFYTFDTVSSGIYHILAIPDLGTIYSRLYLPTYYGDAFLWENSTPVILGQPVNPYSIHLVDFDSISGGDGMINGELTTGGKSIDVGNQEILILDLHNNPVKYMFSQPDGSFSFEGLPYGEYNVYPVITGIITLPVTVVLSATNSTAHVVMKIKGQYVSGISETFQPDFIENMYPNPMQNEIYIKIKSVGKVKIQILDALGKIVFSNTLSISSMENVITIPVSEFKPGLYILVVQDEKGIISSRRLVKN